MNNNLDSKNIENEKNFLQVKDIKKAFGEKKIESSFSLEKSKALALLGPSGCGKTTILKIIAGLLKPDSGSIILNGVDITKLSPAKRHIGMVFQDYALFPHLSVEDNISYALVSQGMSKKNARNEIKNLIELFNLNGLEKRKPNLLSGGEKQRVSLARSLAAKPDLILFDEPLSALDADLRIKLRKELRQRQVELGYTAIYVTHDKDEAKELADSIVSF